MADGTVQCLCPSCGTDVLVDLDFAQQSVRCPHCESPFYAEPTSASAIELPPDIGELNADRIRRLSANRRATLRIRSWWMIGLVLSALTAVDLLVKAVIYVVGAHGWGARPTLFVTGGLAFLAVTRVALRGLVAVGKEAAKSSPVTPPSTPDFSTLDDGSNRWRRLEQL